MFFQALVSDVVLAIVVMLVTRQSALNAFLPIIPFFSSIMFAALLLDLT